MWLPAISHLLRLLPLPLADWKFKESGNNLVFTLAYFTFYAQRAFLFRGTLISCGGKPLSDVILIESKSNQLLISAICTFL